MTKLFSSFCHLNIYFVHKYLHFTSFQSNSQVFFPFITLNALFSIKNMILKVNKILILNQKFNYLDCIRKFVCISFSAINKFKKCLRAEGAHAPSKFLTLVEKILRMTYFLKVFNEFFGTKRCQCKFRSEWGGHVPPHAEYTTGFKISFQRSIRESI